ncbi:MAG: hypothetical protein FWF37_02195 [Chloroflexi bacterium]|nr:hypothetical protein [Chloroflexota bacterium]
MNELIQRYIYDVIRRLPNEERTQIHDELYWQIQDMLPSNASIEDINIVLNNMGSPAKLAEKYRAHSRYMISPAIYDTHNKTLWTVTLVLSIVIAFLVLAFKLFDVSTDPTFMNILGAILLSLLLGSILGFFISFTIVTISFYIYENSNKNHQSKKWTTADLPAIQEVKGYSFTKSSRMRGLIVTIILGGLTFLFVASLYQYVGWYENGQNIYPLFDSQVMHTYLPLVLLIAGIAVTLACLKFLATKWNRWLVFVNFVYHILLMIVTLSFINQPNTFSTAFKEQMAQNFNINMFDMLSYWDRGIFIVSVIFVLLAIISVAVNIWQYMQNQRQALMQEFCIKNKFNPVNDKTRMEGNNGN